MTLFTDKSLAKRSGTFRYVHFLISAVRFKRYATWKAEGEPNPFVKNCYRTSVARHSEMRHMMDDFHAQPPNILK